MSKNTDPLVGVVCITYNQAAYLRDMLDGIAMQQTDFPFVAVIGNDDSSDDTAEILEEYRCRYPHIFKVLNHPVRHGAIENSLIVLDNIPPVRYLAFCEGDDYWTDPLKLQKQVDYMERHQECAICFHIAAVKYENGEKEDEQLPSAKMQKELSPEVSEKLLLENNFIATASIMLRRKYSAAEFRKIYKTDIMPGDWFWLLAHMRFGTMHYIPETMSVYRKHDAGMFSSLERQCDLFFRKYGIRHCRFFEEALGLFAKDSHEYRILRRRYCNFVLEFLASTIKTNDLPTLEHFLSAFDLRALDLMIRHRHHQGLLPALARTLYLYCTPSDSRWEKAGQFFLRIGLKIRDDGLWESIKRAVGL